MAEPKLTPWFKPGTKPARQGVYRTDPKGDADLRYQHWDGEMWGAWCWDVAGAKDNARYKSSVQNPSWRGLATDTDY